jgi:hypothetical protein
MDVERLSMMVHKSLGLSMYRFNTIGSSITPDVLKGLSGHRKRDDSCFGLDDRRRKESLNGVYRAFMRSVLCRYGTRALVELMREGRASISSYFGEEK